MATLGAIVSMKPEHEFEMLLKVLVGYGIVDALIIALMSFRVKKDGYAILSFEKKRGFAMITIQNLSKRYGK